MTQVLSDVIFADILCRNYSPAPKDARPPTHAAQARNPIPQITVPIIEQTKPAVATPLGFLFLAIAPRIMPIMPTITPIQPKEPKNVHTKAIIPNTNDAAPTKTPPSRYSLFACRHYRVVKRRVYSTFQPLLSIFYSIFE